MTSPPASGTDGASGGDINAGSVGSRGRYAAQITFLVVAIGLAAAALGKDWDSAWGAITGIGVAPVILSSLLVVLGSLAACEAWRRCVTVLGPGLSRRDAAWVFYPTQLGKYLPGGVWPFVAQVTVARQVGVDRSEMALAGALFVNVHLVSGAMFAAPLLLTPPLRDRMGWAAWALLAGAVLVMLFPSMLGRGLDVAVRAVGRRVTVPALSRRAVLGPTGAVMITWCCYGLATSLLVDRLAPPLGTWTLLALSTGAFAAAWVIGLLIVIAPAGLGAREVVLVVALAPSVGTAEATALAILLRVLHTAADLLLAGLMARGRTSAK